MSTKNGNGLTATTFDTRARRGLAGLQEHGRAPTRPREVLTVEHESVCHVVKKQTGASCVNGIDKWWVETACLTKLVVTQAAARPRAPTCLMCLMEA